MRDSTIIAAVLIGGAVLLLGGGQALAALVPPAPPPPPPDDPDDVDDEDENPEIVPPPDRDIYGDLDGRTGEIDMAPTLLEADENGNYHLEHGARYLATLTLTNGLAALLIGPGNVQATLQGAGFDEVSVNRVGNGVFQLRGRWMGPTGVFPNPDPANTRWTIHRLP